MDVVDTVCPFYEDLKPCWQTTDCFCQGIFLTPVINVCQKYNRLCLSGLCDLRVGYTNTKAVHFSTAHKTTKADPNMGVLLICELVRNNMYRLLHQPFTGVCILPQWTCMGPFDTVRALQACILYNEITCISVAFAVLVSSKPVPKVQDELQYK